MRGRLGGWACLEDLWCGRVGYAACPCLRRRRGSELLLLCTLRQSVALPKHFMDSQSVVRQSLLPVCLSVCRCLSFSRTPACKALPLSDQT